MVVTDFYLHNTKMLKSWDDVQIPCLFNADIFSLQRNYFPKSNFKKPLHARISFHSFLDTFLCYDVVTMLWCDDVKYEKMNENLI